MRTRSEYKALSHPVLLNELILENVFSFLELKHCLPLRLVCKKWNTALRKEISKNKTAVFSNEPNQQMIGKITESAHYFNLLKITKLNVEHSRILPQATKKYEDENCYKSLLETINKYGKQVKHFRFNYFLITKEDLTDLKKILTLMPNLEYLHLPKFTVVGSFWKVFKDFCHPKVKSLRLHYSLLEENCTKEFITALLKCFPNLETNFGQTGLDEKLFELILDEKVSMKLTSFAPDNIRRKTFGKCLSLLSQLYLCDYKITKFELCKIPDFDLSKAQTIFSIINHFASTLEIVGITYCDDLFKKRAELRLPPLPQLRNLRLEMTFWHLDKSYITFNMGKRMGKDYPLLEYFTFNPSFNYKSFGTSSCKLWQCFVPFEEGANDPEVDLSPLRFLKFVDLNIPPEWTHREENREWCKTFLDAYLKLYGNGGRGTIQHVVDWLN